MAAVFTDSNFQSEVLDAGGLVVVDFWAPWCGPCQMIGPVIEELAAEYEGKVVIGKMNVDENPETPPKLGIMGIPAIKLFKNGEQVDEIVGAQPKESIKAKIDANM